MANMVWNEQQHKWLDKDAFATNYVGVENFKPTTSKLFIAFMLFMGFMVFASYTKGSYGMFFISLLTISGLAGLQIAEHKKEIKDHNLEAIDKVQGFKSTHKLMGENNYGIALNKNTKQIVLSRNTESIVLTPDQIVSIEVVESEGSVTKTNRGSQLGTAAVGGLLFGGIGAVVGGMSGSTTSTKAVSSITLYITTTDFDWSYHPIELLSLKTVNTTGMLGKPIYNNIITTARQWVGFVSALKNMPE